MAEIAIKARSVGAEAVLRRFVTASNSLPHDTLEAQRELGRQAEVAFAAHAPHRTGRLIRGIASVVLGGKVIVKDEARNPSTGYDYVGVTRFGHKVARIYPKHRYSAFVVASKQRRKSARTTGRAALRFTIGGRTVFAASVAGYHPATDWAEDALPEVQAQAQAVATRLGRKIEARF